jgi:hypothetical protein
MPRSSTDKIVECIYSTSDQRHEGLNDLSRIISAVDQPHIDAFWEGRIHWGSDASFAIIYAVDQMLIVYGLLFIRSSSSKSALSDMLS